MPQPPDRGPAPAADKPHGDSGGTRTPAGGTYGDFHPTARHERHGEPYEDVDPPLPTSPVDPLEPAAPPTPRKG